MINFTYINRANQGFSLVETLVAIAILLIVIVGPMSIATNAASSVTFANQQVAAYFLAQEGLELAQKGRDDFLLESFDAGNAEGSNAAWNAFTSGSGRFSDCFSSDGCSLEIVGVGATAIDVDDCSNIADCRLYFTTDVDERSKYTYTNTSASEATDFTRVITMEEVTPDRDILVTSVVSWRTGNQIAVQSTTATTYLYNIYGR